MVGAGGGAGWRRGEERWGGWAVRCTTAARHDEGGVQTGVCESCRHRAGAERRIRFIVEMLCTDREQRWARRSATHGSA